MNFRQGPSTVNQTNIPSTQQKVSLEEAYESLEDYKEAMKWYQLAAEQGSPKAYFNIGQLYNLGKGVEQDYNEATKWFIKVIENKYTNSEVALLG